MELTLPQVNTLVAIRLGLALANRHPLVNDRGEGLATPARPSLWTQLDTEFDPPRIPSQSTLSGLSKGCLQYQQESNTTGADQSIVKIETYNGGGPT